jgi:hypothetical protein
MPIRLWWNPPEHWDKVLHSILPLLFQFGIHYDTIVAGIGNKQESTIPGEADLIG